MNSSYPRLKSVLFALLGALHVLAADDAGHHKDSSDRPALPRLANEAGEKRPHLSALREFADSLDEDPESHRATKRFVDAMSRSKQPRLLAYFSIETPLQQFTAGKPAVISVRVLFRPIQSERYQWKYAVFEKEAQASDYTIHVGGSGESVRNTELSFEISALSEKAGDYALLLVLFGRALPDGKFDLLDYRKLHYTVRPPMMR